MFKHLNKAVSLFTVIALFTSNIYAVENPVSVQVKDHIDYNKMKVVSGKDLIDIKLIGFFVPDESTIVQICDKNSLPLNTQSRILKEREKALSYLKRSFQSGDTIFIEYDKDRTDKDGSSLVYIYLPNHKILNQQVVENGYSMPYVSENNNRYIKNFKSSLESAIGNKKGMWQLLKLMPEAVENLNPVAVDEPLPEDSITNNEDTGYEDALAAINRVEILLSMSREKDTGKIFTLNFSKAEALINEGRLFIDEKKYDNALKNAQEAESIINSINNSLEQTSSEKPVESTEPVVKKTVVVIENVTTSGKNSAAIVKVYVVKWNPNNPDSLRKIAQRLYNDENLWPAIYIANRHKIKDPDIILPGQKFIIPQKPRKKSSVKIKTK